MRTPLEEEILRLKKEKNVLILAHFYEDGEIQDIADFVGDSLFLAQKGQQSPDQRILLAGVVFMAESVKILSPLKHVYVPDRKAGCSLVESSPAKSYLEWRLKYPDHICVTYVNSSAEVKALSDVICTSSNAEKIIQSIPSDRKILFGPDKNLGRFLAKKTNRDFKLWEGSCEVHILFSSQKLMALKQQHPEALVIAHPECDDGVLALSDVVGATSKLLDEVKNNKSRKTFIVATEDGIFHQMKKSRPDVELIQAPIEDGTCGCNQCPYMKLNTLEKIKKTLENLEPEVHLSEILTKEAAVSLQRMMDITEGRSVKWPKSFEIPQSFR